MSNTQIHGTYWITCARYLGLTLAAAIIFGCSNNSECQMSQEERQNVVAEIHERLDSYADAVTRLDIDAMLSFWMDSEEFVFAGDGVILGGYDEWTSLMSQRSGETEQWLHFNFHNVKVVVLSRNAASATVELDNRRVWANGDTASTGGAWTYVLRKDEGEWKVIQTNGTHVEL